MKAVLLCLAAIGMLGMQSGCTCECERCCVTEEGETICLDPIVVERGECGDMDDIARRAGGDLNQDCGFECK
jgi:hypothetical protein